MKHLQSHQVWAYIDGEVDLQQRHKMEAHLANCLVCRDKVRNLRQLGSTFAHVLHREVPGPAPHFHEKLVSAIQQTTANDELAVAQLARGANRSEAVGSTRSDMSGSSRSRWRKQNGTREKRFLLPFSAVAGVVVAVGVGWYVVQSGAIARVSSGKTASAVAVGSAGGSSTGNWRHGIGPNSPSRSQGLVQGNAQQNGSNSLSTTNQGLGPGQTQLALATTATQTLSGQAKVTVQTNTGKPLPGAHVAYVCNGRILATSVTGADGATDAALLTIPVDGVLAPAFSEPGFYPEGDLTVVVWKSGYRPVVSYDMRVFSGGINEYTQTVSMQAADSNTVTPEISGEGADTGTSGYHLLSLSAYVNRVEGAVDKNPSTQPDGSAADKLAVAVTDEAGRPVSGAHVAVVAGTHVSSSGLTTSDGNTPLLGTAGVADWRFVGPWNVNHLSPKTAAVVVWKDGYAPAVGLYVPVSSNQTTKVTARLESLAWRQANNDNNLDAPTSVTPERKPTPTVALNYLNWVTGQGG